MLTSSRPTGHPAAFLFGCCRNHSLAVSLAALATLALPGGAHAAAPWQVRHVTARNLAHGFAAEPSLNDALRPGERAFLGRALESSRRQMRLAEIGVTQAEAGDVRSHALQLATDARSLTDALEALISHKGVAGAPVGGTSETFRNLSEQSAGGFDRAFVKAATKVNDETLRLFEQTASEARDPDIRQLAGAQLPVLRAHRVALIELGRKFN